MDVDSRALDGVAQGLDQVAIEFESEHVGSRFGQRQAQ